MSDHSGAPASAPAPPAARRIPRIDTVHGDRRADDYFWLRGKDDPEVMAYLRAENAHTEAVMKPSAALVDTLYAEMLARIKEDDQSVPYRLRGYHYYSRTEKGKQYPIYCRKAGSLDAPEQVMLDLNQLAEGHPFLALGAASVSDDGRLLAYTTDLTGFRDHTLHVKDLDTGALLPDRVEKVSAVAWAADNQTLFYVTEDEAKRPYRLHRHRLGVAVADLLLEEPDALFRFHVGRPLLRSLAGLLPGSAARRNPLTWDRGLGPAPNPAKVNRSLQELRRLYPALGELQVTRSWAGYIDATPDAIPVIGEAGPSGLVVATGFTGHGFAMGPIVGRLVAELITDGKPSIDLRAFRFSRFAEGAVGKPRSVL
jgi:oligopeptidase B